MKAIAKAISIIFHPLLMATYLIAVLGFYFPTMLSISQANLKIIIAFVFCFTCLLPVVNIIMFKYFGTISSFTMVDRRERLIPFIAISLIYIVMSYLFFNKLPLSGNFNKVMVLVTAMVVFSTIVTFFFKISIHSIAAGGFVGILLPLNKVVESGILLWPTAIAIAITGAIMSARLYLNAHTFNEVWMGALSGFLIGLSGILILF